MTVAVDLASSGSRRLCRASIYGAHRRSTRSRRRNISAATTVVIQGKRGRKLLRPSMSRPPRTATSSSARSATFRVYRRLANRYEKLAQDFLAALCFAATRCYLII